MTRVGHGGGGSCSGKSLASARARQRKHSTVKDRRDFVDDGSCVSEDTVEEFEGIGD